MKIEIVSHNSPRYLQAVAMRRTVLRVPLGLEYSTEDLAREAPHRHLVAIEDEEVIGCLYIMSEPDSARIRQMAVREDCRGKGIGRQLMMAAEREVLDMKKKQIILHARENAVGFYEKLGYVKEGERFIEVTLGHWNMRKHLTPKLEDLTL